MKESRNYLTWVAEDWPQQNQRVLRQCLERAYAIVESLSDPEAVEMFRTPHRSFLAGMLRFGAVDYCLQQACELNLFIGISAEWVSLSGSGVMALELRGRRTSLVAHHLQNPQDPVRESNLRFEKRLANYMNPVLPGLGENSSKEDLSLINLTLAHGDKSPAFAFLRAYDDPDNRGQYIELSGNLMNDDRLITDVAESEQIQEFELRLKEGLDESTKKRAS
jgi:hypothetical protein